MWYSNKPSGGAGPVTVKLDDAVKETSLGRLGKMPELWGLTRGVRSRSGRDVGTARQV